MVKPVDRAMAWVRSTPRTELAMVVWAMVVFVGFLTVIGILVAGVRELWVVYLLIGLVGGILPPKLYFQFRAIRPKRDRAGF